MCSKLVSLVLAVSLVASSGCGLHLDQQAPGPYEMKVSSNQYTCVSQIADRVGDYMNNRLTKDGLDEFMNCLKRAIFMFGWRFHPHSDSNNFFAPDEIRKFIENNFLPPDRKISDELLHQMMVIKQTLVGGDIDKVSYSDLEVAMDILEKIRLEADRLLRFVPVLNPSLVRAEDPNTIGNRIADAAAAARITAQVFGTILSQSQLQYRFADLESFLNEFKTFSHLDKTFLLGKPVHVWVEVLNAFKLAAVSPNEFAIAPTDWAPLIEAISNWYLAYIKFEVGVQNQPFFSGNGFNNIVDLFDTIFGLLHHALTKQPHVPERIISFKVMDRLVFAIKAIGWMPESIRASSVQSALHSVIHILLGVGARPPLTVFAPRSAANTYADRWETPSGRLHTLVEEWEKTPRSPITDSSGFSDVTLSNLTALISQWEEVQIGLQEKFPNETGDGSRVPMVGGARLHLREKPSRDLWLNFESQMGSFRPLFKEGVDGIYLVGEDEEVIAKAGLSNRFYNLSRVNLLRSLVSLIFRGYSLDTVDLVRGATMDARITQQSLQDFYMSVRDFGIDIGFLDPNNNTAGERTFLEAKSFTYLADGIDGEHEFLSFKQAMQEGAFLFSGGVLSRSLFYYMGRDSRGPLCGYINGQMDKKWLLRDCVRDHLARFVKNEALNLPGYQDYLKSLTAEQQKTWADSVITAASNSFTPKGKLGISEFATMSTIIHYTESVLTNYDRNHDGILDEGEINDGLPVFGPLISYLGAKAGQTVVSPGNVLKFILQYGVVPTCADDKYKILEHAAGDLIGVHQTWGMTADRLNITRVFIGAGQLSPSADPNTPKACIFGETKDTGSP